MSRTRKKCGTVVQLCVVRSAIRRAMALSAAGACGGLREARLRLRGALRHLRRVIVPSGPVPRTLLRSTPCSSAMRRALGEIFGVHLGGRRPVRADAAADGPCGRACSVMVRAAGAASASRPAASRPAPRSRRSSGPPAPPSPSRCLHAGQNAVGRSLDLQHDLIGFDFEQRLALGDGFAFLLQPGR